MLSPPPLSNLGNLIGLDGVVILGLQLAFVVGLILLIRFFVRGRTADKSNNAPTERLRRLEAMRDQGVITAAEYQEQRQRILTQI